MTLRSLTPVVFTTLCLALSGLVLRRQMAAHPLPPVIRASQPAPGDRYQPDFSPPEMTGQPVDEHTWHIVTGARRVAVIHCIQGQLVAFRAGDAETAVSFMRHRPARHFPAQFFQARIEELYPEFGHARTVVYGPVWMDRSGQHADTRVKVEGDNGKSAAGTYKLVRQDGVYRVAGLRGGGWMGE